MNFIVMLESTCMPHIANEFNHKHRSLSLTHNIPVAHTNAPASSGSEERLHTIPIHTQPTSISLLFHMRTLCNVPEQSPTSPFSHPPVPSYSSQTSTLQTTSPRILCDSKVPFTYHIKQIMLSCDQKHHPGCILFYKSARVCGGWYCHTKMPPSLPTDTIELLSGVTAVLVTVPLCATPTK